MFWISILLGQTKDLLLVSFLGHRCMLEGKKGKKKKKRGIKKFSFFNFTWYLHVLWQWSCDNLLLCSSYILSPLHDFTEFCCTCQLLFAFGLGFNVHYFPLNGRNLNVQDVYQMFQDASRICRVVYTPVKPYVLLWQLYKLSVPSKAEWTQVKWETSGYLGFELTWKSKFFIPPFHSNKPVS